MLSLAKHNGIARLLTLATLFAASACAAAADPMLNDEDVDTSGAALSSHCAPPVDPAIVVPAGHRLALSLDAAGVQIYMCQVNAAGTGYAWVFQAPEATLYNARGREVGTHYAGPTWQYKDGSKVMASRLAGVTPDPTSIPWLLLQATTHEGLGRLAGVTYIQRLETTGGVAPAAASCNAEHMGEVARVDYTAVYHFFEAGPPPCGCEK